MNAHFTIIIISAESDGLLEMIAIEQKSVHKSNGPAAVLLSAGQKHDKVNHILN